jgi:hypothetical protein
MKNISIQELTLENFTSYNFNEFFSDYSNESFYQKTLKINSDKFSTFQVDKLYNSLLNARAKFWITINEKDEVKSVFGINKDINLSTIYGKEIYMLSPFYNFKKEQAKAFPFIMEVVEDYRKKVKASCIRIKIRSIDHENIAFFEDNHYHYYAGAVKFFFDIRKISSSRFYDPITKLLREKGETKRLIIEDYSEIYLEKCLQLISQHQKNEKFYNNKVDRTKTLEVFKKWFINKSKDSNFKIQLLVDTKYNKLAGLVVFFKPGFFNKYLDGHTLYSPDLVILEEVYKKTGAAYIMLARLLNKLQVSIEGQTMSDNFDLHSFVTDIGFKSVDSFVFLEKIFKH